jgi:hypothetical protein
MLTAEVSSVPSEQNTVWAWKRDEQMKISMEDGEGSSLSQRGVHFACPGALKSENP